MTNAANTTSQTSTCRRCGRTLTSARSIREAGQNGGYGRGCATKITDATLAVAATETTSQIQQATELIEDGAIVHWTHHLYLSVSTDGGVYYETMPAAGTHGACTCKAGQYGRRCYHLVAADILIAADQAATVQPVAIVTPVDPFAVFDLAA